VIVYISDFDMIGSGYMQLSIALCRELAERGYKVTALGIGYQGAEHNWPFSIIPVRQSQSMMVIRAMWQNLLYLAQSGQHDQIEAVVVALDIPYQARIQEMMQGPMRKPMVGIFPVESGPLISSWAAPVAAMDEKLVISQFGLAAMKESGVEGTFLPLGLDTEAWRPPSTAERAALRESLGFSSDQFVVLTVADNQERKNLWAAMETVRLLSQDIDAQWIAVTRVHSPYGWRIDELAIDMKIVDRVMTFDRGLAFDRLWTLFAVADAFLLPSKAEGFCMPLIEAMACGLPVVATDCTAVPEQIWDDYPVNTIPRGFPIAVEYRNIDVWGNSMRSWASPSDARDKLKTIAEWRKAGDPRLAEIIARGIAYARSRTWHRAGDVLAAAIDRVKIRAIAPPPPVLPGLEPMTVPRIIPQRFAEDGAGDQLVPERSARPLPNGGA